MFFIEYFQYLQVETNQQSKINIYYTNDVPLIFHGITTVTKYIHIMLNKQKQTTSNNMSGGGTLSHNYRLQVTQYSIEVTF